MTTIAWDGKTLASDSQSNTSFITQKKSNKLHNLKDKVIATSGCSGTGIAFSKGEFERFPDMEADALFVIKKTGKCFYQGMQHSIPCGKIHAIGTGADFAMGAMLAGATALEAVKIAIKLDPNSGGRVQSVKIK